MLLAISTRHQCAYDVYTVYIFILYIYVSIKDLAPSEKNGCSKILDVQGARGTSLTGGTGHQQE